MFKDSKLPSPDEQMVTPPKVDKKPLGEAFKEVLKQVDANIPRSRTRSSLGRPRRKRREVAAVSSKRACASALLTLCGMAGEGMG